MCKMVQYAINGDFLRYRCSKVLSLFCGVGFRGDSECLIFKMVVHCDFFEPLPKHWISACETSGTLLLSKGEFQWNWH